MDADEESEAYMDADGSEELEAYNMAIQNSCSPPPPSPPSSKKDQKNKKDTKSKEDKKTRKHKKLKEEEAERWRQIYKKQKDDQKQPWPQPLFEEAYGRRTVSPQSHLPATNAEFMRSRCGTGGAGSIKQEVHEEGQGREEGGEGQRRTTWVEPKAISRRMSRAEGTSSAMITSDMMWRHDDAVTSSSEHRQPNGNGPKGKNGDFLWDWARTRRAEKDNGHGKRTPPPPPRCPTCRPKGSVRIVVMVGNPLDGERGPTIHNVFAGDLIESIKAKVQTEYDEEFDWTQLKDGSGLKVWHDGTELKDGHTFKYYNIMSDSVVRFDVYWPDDGHYWA